jgi:hypothetical protein
VHGNLVDGSSVAGGCSKASGDVAGGTALSLVQVEAVNGDVGVVFDGSIVAIEEVQGGLPRPPELAAGDTCPQVVRRLSLRPISPLRPLTCPLLVGSGFRVVLRQLLMRG